MVISSKRLITLECFRASQRVRSHLTGRGVQQLHLSQLFATSIAASKQCRALKSNDAETQELRASGVGKLASTVKLPAGSLARSIRQGAAVAPPSRVDIRYESRAYLPSSGSGRMRRRRAI